MDGYKTLKAGQAVIRHHPGPKGLHAVEIICPREHQTSPHETLPDCLPVPKKTGRFFQERPVFYCLTCA
jgi:hypothetical protein